MTQENIHSEGRWYVVQTLSNLEGKVKRFIEKQLAYEEMEDFLFEVLMPTEVVSEVKAGKKSQKTRKLYPGYVFLHMRLYDEEGKLLHKPWYFINGIDGVIGFVGGNHPHALKDDEIARILDHAKEAVGKEVPKVQYELGENVRITDGPFLNLNGTIDEIDPDAGKLKVSVSIFGRFTPVTLEYWQVERVTE
ncbi:MAG: transcription termination/antitermination protein NusG [Opitutales bacterium]|jgi:transcriptional antiterminator NusG